MGFTGCTCNNTSFAPCAYCKARGLGTAGDVPVNAELATLRAALAKTESRHAELREWHAEAMRRAADILARAERAEEERDAAIQRAVMSFTSNTEACAALAEMHQLIETLLYWNDRGGIDESWWDEARALLARKDG